MAGNELAISGDNLRCIVERASACLRWVVREGSHVLQQAFEITELENGNATGMRVEWRDVPIESEAGAAMTMPEA